MWAIYKKELRGFFHSFLGWFYIAFHLFFAGWYFRFYGMLQGLPYISYVISGILLISLFGIPILTMRSFSEEMRMRTDQLLYTSPLSVWKIILGKYFAFVSVFGAQLLVISFYPCFLQIFGEVPVGENYLAVLGFFLFGMAAIAIGILISSLTENQIIAAVLTFFVLMTGVMIPEICDFISPGGNFVTKILQMFDLTAQMDYTLYGMLYLPSFLYYFSVTFVCLYLTGFLILKRRWRVATHGIGKVLGSTAQILFWGIVIVGVNFLVSLMPKEYVLLDMTYNGIYSLTEESKEALSGLESDVTLYVLQGDGEADDTILATVEGMEAANEHIHAEYISLEENPYFYTTYTDTEPPANSIIVVSEDKSIVVNYYDCYQVQYDYEYNYESGEYLVTDYKVTGYDGEGRIISAIMQTVSSEVPKIYCITGHDEIVPDTELASLLSKANVQTQMINLLDYETIPEDTDCVFLLGPLVDYSAEEAEKITAYLEGGGKAIFAVAFTDADELEVFHGLLSPYGMEVLPGYVMEQGASYYNSYEYFLLPEILYTDITEGVYSTLRTKYVYMPYAKGIVFNEEAENVWLEPFLQTTANAYLMTDYSGTNEATETGVYYLGVYARKAFGENISEIIVFSSDYFLYEDVNMAVNGNNYTVFINGVNKLIGKEAAESIIPVKNYSYDPIMMDEVAINLLSVILVGVIPLVFLSIGFAVWIKRRKL
ncbi:MAG: Gldg family protein [Lachnospiraceae bacterium]|nr:Gldg family protein [Lachnospiraceae bacterium]